MNTHWNLLLGTALAAAVATSAPAGPATGQSPRYCNPLPMVSGSGVSASGDVTVIRDHGKYYMYCTGGGAWISDDLANWTFQHVPGVPIAPHVVKFNGAFYLGGNDGPLFKSDNPLGPFTELGPWTNTPNVAGGWNDAFDIDIFVDDDNQPYLYYPGRGVSGIYGVPLDPKDLTRFTGPPAHLFAFNKDHVWERYGEMNEYPDVAWVEGPWLQKHNGTYYLEYSASGTQWKTYAEGYYTAKSPLGPFTYAPNNPLLRKTDGLVTGTGHGSIVEGPDGHLWQFYTIVLNNPPGGRRIGMDPVGFDQAGKRCGAISLGQIWRLRLDDVVLGGVVEKVAGQCKHQHGHPEPEQKPHEYAKRPSQLGQKEGNRLAQLDLGGLRVGFAGFAQPRAGLRVFSGA